MESRGIHPHIVAGPSAANALWVTSERISFAGTDRFDSRLALQFNAASLTLPAPCLTLCMKITLKMQQIATPEVRPCAFPLQTENLTPAQLSPILPRRNALKCKDMK